MKTLGIYSSKNTSPTIYCLLFKPYICHYDKKTHWSCNIWQMFWPSTYSMVISPMENLLQRIEGRFKPESILWLERSVFLKNFEKKIFWYYYFFWKDLSKEYLVISKFLLEVPKFRENVLICIITVIKVSDLLLTLLQVRTMLAT